MSINQYKLQSYILCRNFYLYSILITMEEKKQANLQSKQVTEQLKNIDKIEKSILDLQAHIRFLLKRQNDENKKINKLYDLSIRKAVSKISFASSIVEGQEKKKKRDEQSSIKNSQVKQFRERQMNLMKQTRLQISKLREMQRSEVKQISKRNDDRIKKMKQQQRMTNFNKAADIKSKHAEYISQKKQQKQREKKQKQEQFLKRSLIKISEKDKLQLEIQRLKEQEQQIQARLQKKKLMKLKLHDTARKISSMDNSQLIEKTKNYKSSGLTTPTEPLEQSQHQQLQKTLIKSAVQKLHTHERQPIMLFR